MPAKLLALDSPYFPSVLSSLPDRSPLSYLGNLNLLQQPLLGVFSSVKCPASLILKAHDTAKELSASGQAVISGFQSPAEKEMLTVLLRGTSPVVICPARGLDGMRIPVEWKKALDSKQLLLLSPFPSTLRRATAELAEGRNRMVIDLAQRVLIIHAMPGGKLEALCQSALHENRNLFTINLPSNQNLLTLGAKTWTREIFA